MKKSLLVDEAGSGVTVQVSELPASPELHLETLSGLRKPAGHPPRTDKTTVLKARNNRERDEKSPTIKLLRE